MSSPSLAPHVRRRKLPATNRRVAASDSGSQGDVTSAPPPTFAPPPAPAPQPTMPPPAFAPTAAPAPRPTDGPLPMQPIRTQPPAIGTAVPVFGTQAPVLGPAAAALITGAPILGGQAPSTVPPSEQWTTNEPIPIFTRVPATPSTSEPSDRTDGQVTWIPRADSQSPAPLPSRTLDPTLRLPTSASTPSPNKEVSTTITASDSHDSYARLMVSLIVLGLVVIAMLAAVGGYMEYRRRQQHTQRKHVAPDDGANYYDRDTEDPLDGYDDPESWAFDSNRTPRAYL